MRRYTKGLLLGLLAVVVCAVGVVANQARVPSVMDDQRSAATALSALDVDTVLSPGIAIAVTGCDFQHRYRQGRQIATNPGSNTIHFVWTYSEEGEYYYRFVYYNSWNKTLGQPSPDLGGYGVSLGDFARAGYAGIDVNGDNLCQMTLEQRIQEDFAYTIWHLQFPLEGLGLHVDKEMPPQTIYPDDVEQYWPDITVGSGGMSAGDVIHIIAEGTFATQVYGDPSGRIWYWRYDAGAPLPAWEGPVVVDSSRDIGYSIAADDDSGKVAVALTSDWSTDGFGSANNIVYRESRSAGLSWITGAELGAAYRNTITAYTDYHGPQAGIETSLGYDHSGALHIIFTEQPAVDAPERIAIKHWSNANGAATTVTEALYDNPCAWEWLGNLGQITLGIGDGATLCDGGTTTNEDYLYVFYTKLGGATPEEIADTSTGGLSNAELYLTVSPFGGAAWSDPVNLTNTKTPDCSGQSPDNPCASEAWGSIARDVSDIEILYIRDHEAGWIYESGWSMNDVMYLNYPGGAVDAAVLCPGLTCYCPCHSDPACDGLTNVLDVVHAVDVAFRSAPSVFNDSCPYAQTDVDCTGATDVLDVVRLVNVAFRGGDPESQFCEECP